MTEAIFAPENPTDVAIRHPLWRGRTGSGPKTWPPPNRPKKLLPNQVNLWFSPSLSF